MRLPSGTFRRLFGRNQSRDEQKCSFSISQMLKLDTASNSTGSNSLFIIVYDCLQYDDIQKLASLKVVLEECNYRDRRRVCQKYLICYYNVGSGNAYFQNHSNLYHEAVHKLWILLLQQISLLSRFKIDPSGP